MVANFTSQPTERLRKLLGCIERGEFGCQITQAALQSRSLDAVWQDVNAVHQGNPDALISVLQAVLSERASQSATRTELVWSGPEFLQSTARDTRVVLHDVLKRARTDVLVAGYAFDTGKDILKPLHEAMRDFNVRARIVLDVPRDDKQDSAEQVSERVAAFISQNWPFGPPTPLFYHYPPTSSHTTYASMHAKVVVVDSRWTLIGSANFTRRAHDRNIEMGVLIESPAFAEQVIRHWQGLMSKCVLADAL